MGAQALVVFLDSGSVEAGDASDTEADARPDDVRWLHTELKAARDALLASHNGHEAAFQDSRASNEELQSINEEYRSTAEELETSKEELQSINEELHTVNAELKSKLASISVALSDLQNLTAATEIGTLFLDPDLRIRMLSYPLIFLPCKIKWLQHSSADRCLFTRKDASSHPTAFEERGVDSKTESASSNSCLMSHSEHQYKMRGWLRSGCSLHQLRNCLILPAPTSAVRLPTLLIA